MIETVLNVTAIQPIESEVFGVTLSRRGNRGHGSVDAEHLPVRRRRRLDRRDRAHRRAVARAGRADGPTVVGRRWPVAAIAERRERADEIDRRLQDWFAGRNSGSDASSVLPPRAFPPRRWCRRRWSPRTRNCATADSSSGSTIRAPVPAGTRARRSPGSPAGEAGCIAAAADARRAQRRGAARSVRADRRRPGRLAASGVIGTRPRAPREGAADASNRRRILCEANGFCESIAQDIFELGEPTWCRSRRATCRTVEIDVRAAVDQCPKAALRLVD